MSQILIINCKHLPTCRIVSEKLVEKSKLDAELQLAIIMVCEKCGKREAEL